MSAPESILSIAGVQGPTQNTSAESLNNKTNPANAALFVSIMEQYAPGSASKMESWSARARSTPTDSAGDTGKVLPAMPAGLPIVPDAALEEFAVDLGIDRSLARLLLRETATDSLDAEAIGDRILPSGLENPASDGAAVDVTTATAVLPTDLSRTSLGSAQGDADRRKASVASLGAMRDTAIGQRSARVAVALGGSSSADAEVAALGMGLGDSPLADEDVLRWRAASARGGVSLGVAESTRLETVFKPLGLEALRGSSGLTPGRSPSPMTTPTVSTSATMTSATMTSAAVTPAALTPAVLSAGGSPLGAMIAGSSGFDGLSIAGADRQADSVAVSPQATSPIGSVASESVTSSNVAILPAVGLVTKEFGSKNSVLNEALKIDHIAAQASADPMDVVVAGREMTGLSSDAWLALSASGLRRQGLLGAAASDGASGATSAATSIAASAAGSASLAGATLPSGLLVSHDPASAQARPIPLPSTTLDYDTRAEQFAEQVGQRLIQQMRADRWTVSLQLDPRNLGPVDIALEIDGSDVRANLAVVNADVRALLEAGMPRLRETLEMAGYQLSGWSMADSAGREAATQQFAQGFIERHTRGSQTTTADEAMESNVSRGDVDGSERGIDLYV